jgi:hypothetical protein
VRGRVSNRERHLEERHPRYRAAVQTKSISDIDAEGNES